MNDKWPKATLQEILMRSDEQVDLQPEVTYRQVTVRLWGKGVAERGKLLGSEIAAERQFVVRTNQFIISRIDARNGASGLIPPELDGAVVTNDFPVFDMNRDRILPDFLKWLSKTQGFIDLCKTASEGTTNRVRLQESRFFAMKIALPPLPEQRRIVARIEEIARKIAEVDGLGEQSILDETHLLLGAYHRITSSAAPMPMREVAPLVRRPVEVNPFSSYSELGIRCFGKGTFHKPSLNGAEVGNKRLYRIAPDDLVFNNVFAWEGAIAVAQTGDAGRVGSHRFITCVPKNGLAASRFLCFHFLTREGLQAIGDASPGGAGRNRTLGLEALEAISVPVPEYHKQLWFDELQDRIGRARQTREAISNELRDLLPSVLDKAFRGEL